MANYRIGLDFGTSQTKVCLLNIDSDTREFIKFHNKSYFLPTVIIKKPDDTFSYGNENVKGIQYRYFKMSAAEDEDLIKITNEDLNGDISGEIDDYRKYSSNFDIKPEVSVILYLAYIYLYIKNKKKNNNIGNVGGLLGRLVGNKSNSNNTFSINLGIPTEWNNPNHIKRKIKFQTLLLSAKKLAKQFNSLEEFLSEKYLDLRNKISNINNNNLEKLKNSDSSELINKWLKEERLSVFPESAAGINYLLSTRRLADNTYATLDIGAGTSDIAIFKVKNHKLEHYYCSESTSIASNDFYREYAKQLYNKDNISFDEIKVIENIINSNNDVDEEYFRNARNIVKGNRNNKGIEFTILKTFYRKYYKALFSANQIIASRLKDNLNESPIIVFGGGSNLNGFSQGDYRFLKWGTSPYGNHDALFIATPITNYVEQVNINNDKGEIKEHINLLILALGLTYGSHESDYIPFSFPEEDIQIVNSNNNNDRYFYYDLQEAAYK